MSKHIDFVQVGNAVLADDARHLFDEYHESIVVDLHFQDFKNELATLPGKYVPPKGRLYLAFIEEKLAGCIALRPFSETQCEMKRLYVRPDFRGLNVGRRLVMKLISDAKAIGYKEMLLDTFESMEGAIKLYKSIGFVEIPQYCFNPEHDAIFMKLDLEK